MSSSPTPANVSSLAEYAAALQVDPAVFEARAPEAPEGPDAADVVLAPYLAASHASPAPFPAIAMEILELVRYPDVDLEELARYIRVDGALAGGVLALANSAVYRAVRRIDTIREAVGRLGISEVARLSAAIAMRSLYSADASRAHQAFEPTWRLLFQHAVTVARCASELARQRLVPTPGTEQTFMAGLLHDVGLAAALRATAELVSYGKLALVPEPALGHLLLRVHVGAGVELHKGWQLPPTLAEVAAHHHGPVPDTDLAPLVHLVRLVSAYDLLRRAPAMHPRAPAEIADSARALGVPPDRVRALAADLDAAEAWVATAFPG
jgi:putative nucleotidyltransferase with HDIG domain